MKSSRLPALLLLSVLSLPPRSTLAVPPFSDDFDDGSDNGWVHYDPLNGLGAGGLGVWSVVNGAYRLQAAPALAPSSTGPARVGSYRTNFFVEFTAQMDLVTWDTDLDEIFGVLGRVREPGLGTTDGYAFTYSTRAGRAATGLFEILRITNERGTTLASFALTPTPGQHYRMVFTGLSSQLQAQLFDLTNAVVPVFSLAATDSIYAAGYAGMFVYDNSPAANNAVDLTVDNFSAAPPRPKFGYTVDVANQTMTIAWPTWAASYELELCSDLPNWLPANTDVQQNGAFFTHTEPLETTLFFRLVSH